MKTLKRIHVVIAAGGTGGHIIPAIALKENLINLGHKVTFITDKRFESYGFEDDGSFVKLDLPKFSKHPLKLIKFLIKLFALSFKVSSIYKKTKPGIVIGFGGYPSLPSLIAAMISGIKIAIHEQNTVIGRSNKLFLPFVKVVATTFPNIINLPDKYKNKLFLTGMPIRSNIEALAQSPYPKIIDNAKINILVIGGSQGAKIFSDIVPDAIAMLDKTLRSKLRINQQCHSQQELKEVEEKYRKLGISADVALFFKDMAHKLAPAHLVIARAGASTISELFVCAKPAILVPYPFAKDNHQLHNAKYLEEIGLAWVSEQKNFTKESLHELLTEILNNPLVLLEKSENAKKHNHYNSTSSLSNMLIVEAMNK